MDLSMVHTILYITERSIFDEIYVLYPVRNRLFSSTELPLHAIF